MKKVSMLVFSLVFSSSILTAPLFAAEVKLIPSGNRVFTLQGYDIPNVGGIEAVIEYENMQNPQVQRGSIINNSANPMFVANVNLPGKVILAALQANNQFAGTGPIAIISFQPIAGKTGTARLTKIKLATEKSSIDPATTNSPVSDLVSEGNPPADNPPADNPPADNPPADNPPNPPKEVGVQGNDSPPRVVGGGWLGSVTMPNDGSAKSGTETVRSETQQEPAPYQQPEEPQQTASRDTPPAEEPRESVKAPGEQKFTAHKGLLDQFRDFKEIKTPNAMTALFDKYSVPGVRQEPPIALSDGKTVVTVSIDLPAAGKQSPNFALKGAKLVSLKNDEKGTWIIEALPAKNANDVRVTALQDEMMTEIPLTVAQPLTANPVSREKKWDEAAFALFLKERGAEKAPQFDLNGDGLRNYIDDYIYTANYIVRNNLLKKDGAGNKPPVKDAGKEAVKPLPAPPPSGSKPVRPK